MGSDHKGNATEKVDDAIQALLMLIRILNTSTITTEDLIERLNYIGKDLEDAKKIIGYI